MIHHEVLDLASHWMMSLPDKLVLEACIAEGGHGDYLEIGVNHGASLVFAAVVKREIGQRGRVHGIESSEGYKDAIDKLAHEFGVSPVVTYKKSDPWPLDKYMRPQVALIDGDHDGKAAAKDWDNLKHRTLRFILFHDRTWPGVADAVEIAKRDDGWKYIESDSNMAVFERR